LPDIDECKLHEKYNCSNGGTCKNRLNGYDCPCGPGMTNKGGKCSEIFPTVAKAVVGKHYFAWITFYSFTIYALFRVMYFS
jgi:hypothetical protein